MRRRAGVDAKPTNTRGEWPGLRILYHSKWEHSNGKEKWGAREGFDYCGGFVERDLFAVFFFKRGPKQ